jgi:hypothetical protein
MKRKNSYFNYAISVVAYFSDPPLDSVELVNRIRYQINSSRTNIDFLAKEKRGRVKLKCKIQIHKPFLFPENLFYKIIENYYRYRITRILDRYNNETIDEESIHERTQ